MRRSLRTSVWINWMSFFRKKQSPLWICCLRRWPASRTCTGSRACRVAASHCHYPHWPTPPRSRPRLRWLSPVWHHPLLPLCCWLCQRTRRVRGALVLQVWPLRHPGLLQRPLPCPLPPLSSWGAASQQPPVPPQPQYLWLQLLLCLSARMRRFLWKRTRSRPEAATESQRAGHGVP